MVLMLLMLLLLLGFLNKLLTAFMDNPTAGVLVKTFTHITIAIMGLTYAELGEKPYSTPVEQIAAKMYDKHKEHSAHGHHNSLAWFSPIQQGIDGCLIFSTKNTNKTTIKMKTRTL